MVVKKKWKLKNKRNGILRVSLQLKKIVSRLCFLVKLVKIKATKKSWLIKILSGPWQKIVIPLEK
jgi:hypothetical protein